jgi:hypothetical protein
VDTAFLVVVAICLCFVTGMIVVRLGAAGEPSRRIAMAAVELWLALALWTAAMWFLGTGAGDREGLSIAEAAGGRLAELCWRSRVLLFAGLVASVAMVGHLIWLLRRATPGAGGS